MTKKHAETEIKDAMKVLENSGFAVECLWHTDDVINHLEKFDDDERALIDESEHAEILDEAVNNDYVTERLNDTLYQIISDLITDRKINQ